MSSLFLREISDAIVLNLCAKYSKKPVWREKIFQTGPFFRQQPHKTTAHAKIFPPATGRKTVPVPPYWKVSPTALHKFRRFATLSLYRSGSSRETGIRPAPLPPARKTGSFSKVRKQNSRGLLPHEVFEPASLRLAVPAAQSPSRKGLVMMMKKWISLLTAGCLTLGMTAVAFAASNVKNPVGSVSSDAYAVDEDDSAMVDLSQPVYEIAYGKTAYYPLYNAGGNEALSEAKEAWDRAKAELSEAQAAYNSALDALRDAEIKLNELKNAAEDAKDASLGAKDAAARVQSARTAAETAAAKAAEWQKAADTNAALQTNTDLSALQNTVTQKAAAYAAAAAVLKIPANQVAATADAAVVQANALAAPGASGAVLTVVTAAREWQTAQNAAAAAQKSLDDAAKAVAAGRDGYQAAVKAYNSAASANVKAASTPTSAVSQAAALIRNVQDASAAADSSADDAQAAYENFLNGEYKALETAKDSAFARYTAAQAAETAAHDHYTSSLSDDYPFVNEYDAVRSVRIKKSWDVGGTLVKDIEIVKKRFTPSDGYSASERYIYFLAITMKEKSSATVHDLSGTVRLSKSGANGFDEIRVDVNLEVGYQSPSSENTIPETPAVFKKDDGFSGDGVETFYFEADDYSYFDVNTSGQGKILLGMDTEFDDSIAKKYPDANLDFWNGNEASFNKIGELHLSAEPGSYLYQINSSGRLVRPTYSYDRTEECFVVRTRTLGRYVISDKKLDISSTALDTTGSSGSVGSANTVTGTINSAGTVTAVVDGNTATVVYPNPSTGGYGDIEILMGTGIVSRPGFGLPVNAPEAAGGELLSSPAETGFPAADSLWSRAVLVTSALAALCMSGIAFLCLPKLRRR